MQLNEECAKQGFNKSRVVFSSSDVFVLGAHEFVHLLSPNRKSNCLSQLFSPSRVEFHSLSLA